MATTENETTTGTETGQEVAVTTEESTGTDTGQEETTEETEEVTTEGEQQLPDTHPLVKRLAAQKRELKTLGEKAARVDELEAKVTELTEAAGTPSEEHTALQARYDRLEALLGSSGSPLSKALDSRAFSKALFETDTPVADVLTAYLTDNPAPQADRTATSAAASKKGAAPAAQTPSINDLLRIAAGKQ